MPIFVHIADERHSSAIRRNGLKIAHWRKKHALPDTVTGIFAMPVISNFFVSHQWVRELKSRGFRTAVGVYFRVPDDEEVWIGRYNEERVKATAAMAHARLSETNALGFEAVIPRNIDAREIRAIRHLPQTLGWRYFPGAHEKGVFCGCEYCQKGLIKSRKIRTKYENENPV